MQNLTDWLSQNGSDHHAPILIAGPTASGKTGLAIKLAQDLSGTILNADAIQVYDCWNILSARPSPEEMAAADHHLFGHVAWDQPYSVGHWLKDVQRFLSKSTSQTGPLIIVGGTGLYFTALTEGLAEIPETPGDIRAEADEIIRSGRIDDMKTELQRFDPETYSFIDQENPVRVQRAWEVWRSTGRGLREWQSRTPPPLLPKGRFRGLVLESGRDWLADRIDRRFRQMLDRGALKECKAAIARGWDPTLPSSKAIGAQSLIDFLNGKSSREEAIERAVILSRQYAKRQRSWFRNRMADWSGINSEAIEAGNFTVTDPTHP